MLKKNLDGIKKNIKKASNIFIMGHKDLDLDAFGAALGMYCYASNSKKKAYIIIDDSKNESGVMKAIDKFSSRVNIIKSTYASTLINSKSLLIIVDTNKPHLLQKEDIIKKISCKIVFDHHDLGESSIKGTGVLNVVDQNASSSCEMLAEMLKKDNFSIDSDVATIILAGIVLDTNNFVIKTNQKTYYSAYYLTKCGADPKEVQYLLKQDIKRYIERQKVITEVKVINHVAVSRGLQTEVYRREELAKIADTILLFNDISASFVVGKISKNTIGVSARSIGKINVGKIMEELGGGGDEYEAATKIEDKSLNEVSNEIINIVNKI